VTLRNEKREDLITEVRAQVEALKNDPEHLFHLNANIKAISGTRIYTDEAIISTHTPLLDT
jgi:hypothetical protein